MDTLADALTHLDIALDRNFDENNGKDNSDSRFKAAQITALIALAE